MKYNFLFAKQLNMATPSQTDCDVSGRENSGQRASWFQRNIDFAQDTGCLDFNMTAFTRYQEIGLKFKHKFGLKCKIKLQSHKKNEFAEGETMDRKEHLLNFKETPIIKGNQKDGEPEKNEK